MSSFHESDLKARWRRRGVQETEEGCRRKWGKGFRHRENSQNAEGKVQVWELPVECSWSE